MTNNKVLWIYAMQLSNVGGDQAVLRQNGCRNGAKRRIPQGQPLSSSFVRLLPLAVLLSVDISFAGSLEIPQSPCFTLPVCGRPLFLGLNGHARRGGARGVGASCGISMKGAGMKGGYDTGGDGRGVLHVQKRGGEGGGRKPVQGSIMRIKSPITGRLINVGGPAFQKVIELGYILHNGELQHVSSFALCCTPSAACELVCALVVCAHCVCARRILRSIQISLVTWE